jgi:uncharacterized membrane protein YdjX (TVP38/TMEM64 family)
LKPFIHGLIQMTTTQRKLLVKGAILGILTFLIFLISRYGPQPFNLTGPQWQELGDVTEFYSSKKRLKRFLMSFGPYSAAVFTLLQALQVVVAPIPGELTGVVGGYLYGNAFGFLLSTLGLTLGSWVAFELASALGRPFVERLVKKEIIERFNFVTTSAGVTTCFLLFLLPGFPKDYLCYVLGLSRMKLSTFLIISTLGRVPGTYVLTLQGASIRSHEYSIAVIVAVICVVVIFFGYVYRDSLFNWIRGTKES